MPPKGASQTFRLSEPSAICSGLSRFVGQPDLADVAFIVGDRSIPAHRFVLAAGCEVLRTQLYPTDGGLPAEITVNREHTAEVFELLLRYLYTGELTLTEATAAGFFVLASEFKLVQLQTAGIGYILEILSARNAVRFLELGNRFDLQPLVGAVNKLCRTDFLGVLSGDYLHELQPESLAELLSFRSGFPIKEVQLFQRLVDWGTRSLQANGVTQPTTEQLKERVTPHFPHLNFSKMHPKELRDVVRPTELLSLEAYVQAIESVACTDDRQSPVASKPKPPFPVAEEEDSSVTHKPPSSIPAAPEQHEVEEEPVVTPTSRQNSSPEPDHVPPVAPPTTTQSETKTEELPPKPAVKKHLFNDSDEEEPDWTPKITAAAKAPAKEQDRKRALFGDDNSEEEGDDELYNRIYSKK
eukprot:TRINITY_DN41504_c0_g1_i1.p1 TRINITY_DN41504_c0_g1~~TRINITY_DN41504_c0_g1_i1.p1  ORF type:complete len:412 (-),score=85.60 TRINITY_DN41504_c0_g1_i1:17-1252(-)